ncbi:MAG: dihydroorotate dehydrogenase [Planctomycetota bacterium]|nr:MAG: dihydroorotate dehydrogenase [Planctomycetota bacterium]
MDLKCSWLGLELAHPFVSGASPLVDDLGMVKRLEDAGIAAIVMHSLFEEQITQEELGTVASMDTHSDSFGEALSYFPDPEDFHLGPDEYLEQIRRIKESVAVPLVGSLNGTTPGGWLRYGPLIEEAGADALELNLYELPTDPGRKGSDIEREACQIVKDLASVLKIPLTIKLGPYYSSIPHFVDQLVAAGAKGVTIFNRFYQSDIDSEALEVTHKLRLSGPSELLLRLRWLAILSASSACDLSVTGGVHSVNDAIKATMCGAHSIQMVSALLRHGPEYVSEMREGFVAWLEEHEYESVEQMRGSMDLSRSPDPKAFERANYMRVLQSWSIDSLDHPH